MRRRPGWFSAANREIYLEAPVHIVSSKEAHRIAGVRGIVRYGDGYEIRSKNDQTLYKTGVQEVDRIFFQQFPHEFSAVLYCMDIQVGLLWQIFFSYYMDCIMGVCI